MSSFQADSFKIAELQRTIPSPNSDPAFVLAANPAQLFLVLTTLLVQQGKTRSLPCRWVSWRDSGTAVGGHQSPNAVEKMNTGETPF